MSKHPKLDLFSYQMKKNALEMAYAAGGHASHFGAGMSVVDLLAVLYGEILNLPKRSDPAWDDRDRFILSKGHGVIGYYAALVEKGLIPREDMRGFENGNSYLYGHPVQNPAYGIEFSTGSLGMGLSLGVGLAYGAKKKKRDFSTYVLMGDGECGEGSIWEAAMKASHLGLDNLIGIIDQNGLQLGGSTKDILDTSSLAGKFREFGWRAYEVDGHDIDEIYQVFLESRKREGKPTMVVASTKKGRGFSFSEDNNAWHHAVLTEKQYQDAIRELEELYAGH